MRSVIVYRKETFQLVVGRTGACVIEGRRIWEAQFAEGVAARLPGEAGLADQIIAEVTGTPGPLVVRRVELQGTQRRERETEIAAAEVLRPFLDGSDQQRRGWMALLAPREGDAQRVFSPALAALADETYSKLWESPPVMAPREGQSELLLSVACAESISGEFPGGYRQIAGELLPGFVWVCWRFVAPGENLGLAFDGLVRIDDRFAWFPSPWKLSRS